MNTDPEVLFSRYFETLYPSQRKILRGKYDPDPASPFGNLLIDLRDSINESLADHHAESHMQAAHCGLVYFDYIDSEKALLARAFCYEGQAFIGITVAFMEHLWDLSESVAMTAASDFAQSLDISIDPEMLSFALFLSILFFVTNHEFTHHYHGHFLEDPLAFMGWREMSSSTVENGNLEIQAMELDSDSYAVFLVLQNLVKGAARPLALSLLNLETLSERVQNNVLFSCCALAVVSYFFASAPVAVDSVNVYTLVHPQQAKRTDNFAKEAGRWSAKACPELAHWINVEQFSVLINVAAGAVLKKDDQKGWSAQNDFLLSGEGEEYLKRLDTSRNTLMAAVARRKSSVAS